MIVLVTPVSRVHAWVLLHTAYIRIFRQGICKTQQHIEPASEKRCVYSSELTITLELAPKLQEHVELHNLQNGRPWFTVDKAAQLKT